MRLLALAIAVLICPVASGAEGNAPPASPAGATIGVDQVSADPEAHQGPITIGGVVIKAFPERGLFVLVGEQEFKACGLAGCTTALVPVHFDPAAVDGSCPTPGQTVVVTGHLDMVEHGFTVSLDRVQLDGAVAMARRDDPSAAR